MKQIILPKDILALSKQIKASRQKIVLVGGCFDILHLGHIRFLQKAKAVGDVLVILLESDQKIKKTKGDGRPVNSQKDRAEVLSSVRGVDFVVLLPEKMDDQKYDLIVQQLQPDIIATAMGDPNIKFKERTAKLVQAKVKYVMSRIEGYSTGQIIKHL